jgi:hypothetical protein
MFGIAERFGLTTIIDAASGEEQLEYLSWNPLITPNGLVVFKHFYPASADYTIVDESLAELDLNGTIPHDVPPQYGNYADDVGVTIYPRVSTPEVRHYISFFFATDGGTFLFALDKLSSGQVCLVRMQLPASFGSAIKQRCVAPEVFGAHDFSFYNPGSDGTIENFSENASGSLMLTVETGRPRPLIQRSFAIDKISLEATELPITPQNPSAALAIPWPVAKSTLTGFVAPDLGSKDLAPHLGDEIKVVLIIDVSGSVRQATISGLPADISAPLKSAILKWKFHPTMLNGTMVEVTTHFSSPVGGFAKVP